MFFWKYFHNIFFTQFYNTQSFFFFSFRYLGVLWIRTYFKISPRIFASFFIVVLQKSFTSILQYSTKCWILELRRKQKLQISVGLKYLSYSWNCYWNCKMQVNNLLWKLQTVCYLFSEATKEEKRSSIHDSEMVICITLPSFHCWNWFETSKILLFSTS